MRLQQYVDVIMYYLRKKAKYSAFIQESYTITDFCFMPWIINIEKQWRDSNFDMRCISLDHDVGQCIREFRLLANIPWDKVDNILIPVNISKSYHWILVVFRIKHRCLYVYDSMMGGAIHKKRVAELVKKLSVLIPLFLTSTGFYGKRLDIYASKLPTYIDRSQSDLLDYVLINDVPQQESQSNDCGLYKCLFAEFISDNVFEMDNFQIDSKFHRQRYDALLWQYGRLKNNEGAISDNEVTGTVASSRFDGPPVRRDHVPNASKFTRSRPQ